MTAKPPVGHDSDPGEREEVMTMNKTNRPGRPIWWMNR